ncbi:MAG: efflux RND transporter permease subunit [Candidatus Thiodiazotropha sp.]
MILSDISVKRPVFASVLSLLLIAFGLVAYQQLPLREYPNIDSPVVSVETLYRGAAANVVETRITQLIEDRVSGVEGIRFISSQSEDGRSVVTIEFDVDRDIDAAANDVRDRVSTILDDLPLEADPPEIQKVDSNEDVIMWFNLVSDRMTVPELSDYARRYLVDRFSVLDGVARVRVGGGQTFAMRVWIDRQALAARGLTVADVEQALRKGNLELPAGSIDSDERVFTVRVDRSFHTAEDFARLVLARGSDGYLVRLGEVARVEKGAEETRTFFRRNGVPMVGIGIIKQSTANTLEVATAAKSERLRINATLPEGMEIKQSYDSSVFVKGAIKEVYKTLGIAIALVVTVIFLFLGSVRAMIVPAVAVPVSLIATFLVLLVLGFTINILTLLALVLAIGLVVDDAIVMLENIHRRMEEYGEMAAAVAFSSLVALSLSPMLASQILPQEHAGGISLSRGVEWVLNHVRDFYILTLKGAIHHYWLMLLLFGAILAGAWWLFERIPDEYAPKEDRGAFFLIVNGPEGASYDYMKDYMDEIEHRLMPYVESGEIIGLLVRAPRTFSNFAIFNGGIVINVLNDWSQRRSAWVIMSEIRNKLADLPGVRAFPVMRQGFGRRIQKPVQFVIGGGTYEELAEWRDILLRKIEENNPGLEGVDYDYKETKPQLKVDIDYDRASELGVTVETIGRTLETMFGSRRVTTYIEAGEEYDVILEGERADQQTPADLSHLYVRSDTSGELIQLSNLVRLQEVADSINLNRYNRVRAITLEANLADGLALGTALNYLEQLVRDNLPEQVIIDYKGQSRDYKTAGGSVVFVLLLGVVVVYLVLAAQFESWIHPLVIMLTVPLAMAGALLGLYLSDQTLNIYSQIGLIMLVGLAAKNGILIVEFANQLRDAGKAFEEALLEAAHVRFRPILMTGITTAAGSLPLLLSSGAGAETRAVIGTVILAGVTAATVFTLYIVPVAYQLLARHTGSPLELTQKLERELTVQRDKAR